MHVAIEIPHGPVVDSLMEGGFRVHAINSKQVALSEDEVRSWTGWQRHVVLALLLGHADLADVCKAAIGGEAVDRNAERLPLTVPEVPRLAWPRPPGPDQVVAWSAWRRRHQQRARRCHWHRRTRWHELRLYH